MIESVQKLVANGTNEVVLTGVDITSWGHDLPNQPRLGHLVKQILKFVPELPRLRLSSIDPAEPDHQLMDAIATEARLMPHLHLSVQHGDDLILKRMKRRHLARDITRFVDEARRLRPDVVFGADMIAGFPTEDDSAHQNSLALIECCHIPYFMYLAIHRVKARQRQNCHKLMARLSRRALVIYASLAKNYFTKHLMPILAKQMKYS